MSWSTGDPVELRAFAPEAFDAFDLVLVSLPAAVPARLGELSRRRITMLLDGQRDALPALDELSDDEVQCLSVWPTSLHYDTVDRATLELTEQFVIDVSATTADQRTRCLGDLGDVAFGVVQGIYVMDLPPTRAPLDPESCGPAWTSGCAPWRGWRRWTR